ncbi:hypothetical protein [Paroceanicella profunda]|uniref:hypothetical protein n=1 Tax=Paroceanicella profunda TaxID=2579971 RepID=UPI003D288172
MVIFLLIAPLLTSIIMRTFGWQVLFARRGLVNNLLVDQLGLIERPLRLLNSPEIAVAAPGPLWCPSGAFHRLGAAGGGPAAGGIGPDAGRGAAAHLLRGHPAAVARRVGTGAILVFMIANGSFVTLVLLGGGLQTLPLLIYQQFNTTRDFAWPAR